MAIRDVCFWAETKFASMADMRRIADVRVRPNMPAYRQCHIEVEASVPRVTTGDLNPDVTLTGHPGLWERPERTRKIRTQIFVYLPSDVVQKSAIVLEWYINSVFAQRPMWLLDLMAKSGFLAIDLKPKGVRTRCSCIASCALPNSHELPGASALITL